MEGRVGQQGDLRGFLVREIEEYVSGSPLNRLRDIDGSAIFESPLIGFADGDDPLFERYKSVVAPFHMTPREALGRALGVDAAPQFLPALSVVSWVLPVARGIRDSNGEMVEGPSLRWNNMRFQGEEFNDSLRAHVERLLREMGYLAVAPVISPLFDVSYSGNIASTWSERHMAYAAGLGTFSLSDGLITARGIAHRCGSVVVAAALAPTPRPYQSHQEYCLQYRTGHCEVCASRCPAGAIGPDGHDKALCHEHIFVVQLDWLKKPGYIGSYPGCGLCQVGVPCEAGIPGDKVYNRG